MSNMNSKLGYSIVERPLLRTLATLWTGPVAPENLDAIELAIRAYLVSPHLAVSKIGITRIGDWHKPYDVPYSEDDYFIEPTGETILDSDFIDIESLKHVSKLNNLESNFLRSLVVDELNRQVEELIPGWVRTQAQALLFFEFWYDGYTPKECDHMLREYVSDNDEAFSRANIDVSYYIKLVDEFDSDARKPYKRGESLIGYVTGENYDDERYKATIFKEASYLVGCHRAGLMVYGNTPLAEICIDHVFSKWPDYLFKTLGEKFRTSSDELKGPGIGVMLPPLTALLLSRASRRDDIPTALHNLREEYAVPRKKLWDMLAEMWFASNFSAQKRILNKLNRAADSIYDAAFPDRFDALSLAIDATDLLTGNVSSTLSNIRQQAHTEARIGGVTFAAKLAKDLRLHLLNSRDLLKRHFSKKELIDFGTGRL